MSKIKIIKEFIKNQEEQVKVLDYPYKVIYKKVNNPISFVAFFTKIGSIYEQDNEKGIAHLIEHCVFRGSQNFPQDISKMINNLGGYINAYTSYDQTVYYVNLPSDSLYQALDILWDMVYNPLFRKEDIESEKNIIFHEIDMRDDEPLTLLFEETLKKFYKTNPIRHPIIGYKETLNNIQIDDIIKFHSLYKNPQNSFWVIVTDWDLNKISQKLDELFSKISINNEYRNFRYDQEVEYSTLKLKGNVNKTYLMICYKSPSSLEQYKGIEKIYYISLINYILAGSPYSIFNRILKNDLKLVDAVSFDIFSTNELPGILYFSTVCDSKNIDKIIQQYQKIIGNLKYNVEDSFFEIAKHNFQSSAFWNFETSSNQGMLLGSNELFKTYKEAFSYVYKIERISFNDSLEVFYQYVNNNYMISIYQKDDN